jgi:hypothetical protein
METKQIARLFTRCALIVGLIVTVGSALAEEVVVPAGGSPLNVNPETIRFDTALTADVGTAQEYRPVASFSSGVNGVDFYPDVETDHGMGELIGGEAFNNDAGASIDLTNGPASGGVGTRSGIRISWSGRYLVNREGDDFVYTDNGSAGGNEYMVVRVKPVGEDVSAFYYAPADAFQDSNTMDDGAPGPVGDIGDFLTAVDLSDLGYDDGIQFEYVEIFEMLTTDTFAEDGIGFVGAGTALFYRPPQLDQIDTIFGGFISQFFDGDIGYVFAVSSANLVDVP